MIKPTPPPTFFLRRDFALEIGYDDFLRRPTPGQLEHRMQRFGQAWAWSTRGDYLRHTAQLPPPRAVIYRVCKYPGKRRFAVVDNGCLPLSVGFPALFFDLVERAWAASGINEMCSLSIVPRREQRFATHMIYHDCVTGRAQIRLEIDAVALLAPFAAENRLWVEPATAPSRESEFAEAVPF